MNSNISLDILSENVHKQAACHLIPCKITFNGKSNVSNYFTPYIRNSENQLKCSFRGHPLMGKNIPVPQGHVGVILKESKKPLDLNNLQECKDWKVAATFDEFTAWNWDKASSSDDKILKALDWIQVAAELHKPVSEYSEADKAVPSNFQVKRKIDEDD